MALGFDKALGIHQYTLGLRNKNAEVISNNIANADTPNFKARGMNFSEAIKHAGSMQQRPKAYYTHDKHIQLASDNPLSVQFRVPHQPDTGDGNTVDLQFEQAEFMENSLKYQMSLTFLGGKFSGLKKALAGR